LQEERARRYPHRIITAADVAVTSALSHFVCKRVKAAQQLFDAVRVHKDLEPSKCAQLWREATALWPGEACALIAELALETPPQATTDFEGVAGSVRLHSGPGLPRTRLRSLRGNAGWGKAP